MGCGLAEAVGVVVGSAVGSAVDVGVGVGVGVGSAVGSGLPPPPPPDADGVTALEAEDVGPDPKAFVANTLNVYEVPLESPVTEHVVTAPDGVVHATPPGLAVTVYDVIAELPGLVGAVQLTDARASPAVAVTDVGAPGTPGMTGLDAADESELEPPPATL